MRPGRIPGWSTLGSAYSYGVCMPGTPERRIIDTRGYTRTIDRVNPECNHLVKTGDGTLVLLGTASFDAWANGVTVERGTLQFNSSTPLPRLFLDSDPNDYRLNLIHPLRLNGGALRAGQSLTFLVADEAFIPRDPFEVPIELGTRGGTIDTNGFTITAAEIRGAGTLRKIGAGTLLLRRPTTYGGDTMIEAGTLRVGLGCSLPSTSAVTVAPGATLENEGQAVTIGSLEGAGTVALSGGSITVGTNNRSTTFVGIFSGTGALRKVGTGRLEIVGTMAHTGGTWIDAGTLAGTASTLRGAIQNDGSLEFAQGFDGIFGGAISGRGEVVKTGAGTLTLTPQTYPGLTRVEDGVLVSNGLSGAIRVNPNAELRASASIGGSLMSDGRVVPGAGLSIGGDLLLGSTATYIVPALAAGPVRVGGRVAVDGAVLELPQGSSIAERSRTAALFESQGGAQGQFGRVSGVGALDAFISSRNGRTLLTLQRTDVPFASIATDPNGRAAAAAIDAARPGATRELKDVIRELGAMPDAETSAALTQLSGAIYGSALRAGTLDGQDVTRLISTRLHELSAFRPREDTAADPAEADGWGRGGIWVRTLSRRGDRLAGSGSSAMDGGLAGFDRRIARGWIVGGAAGYDRATLDDNQTSEVRDTRYRVGGYAGYVPGAYFVNAALLGARHTYDGARHLAFAATLDPQLGSGPLFGGSIEQGAQNSTVAKSRGWPKRACADAQEVSNGDRSRGSN